MGAWGYGYCDNDTACDFLGELSLYEVDKGAERLRNRIELENALIEFDAV